ncbi:MAG: hypothetical protein MUE61_12140 [Vicinamibacterales bacterium]|nr:hypothetical protein [Vicinamibacterales bacterium]
MLRRECNDVRRGRRAPRMQAIAALALALCAGPAAGAFAGPQAASAPSHRIFLTDGTAVVSFGEFARASGRVVFTVPIGSPSNPDALQVVSLPESAVDWDRTDRYADAVRHQFYAATRGEEDYAALTGAVARALGDIAFSADASSKLAIAADIRRQLLEWPGAHFAYRSGDVRELTAHVEEAISEIRAGSGQRTFDLSLVAMIEPPSEPLLPEPTLKDSLDYAAAVAQMTDSRRVRLSLQQSILAVLERRKRQVPKDWYSATRKVLAGSIEREHALDRDYAELASRTLRDARDREEHADVAALDRLVADAQKEDARLGYQRPETMQALLASLVNSAAKAREKREAIDRYKYRKSAWSAYRSRIDDRLGEFDDVTGDIGAVRALAGVKGRRLSKAERRVAAIEVSLLPMTPPVELGPAHDLLVSSARLMREALRLQRGATTSGDAAATQNASAAAAGALLLLETARTRIDEFFRRPAAP